MRLYKIIPLCALLAALSMTSCSNKKFHVEGSISNAKDSTLYFENMSLNGPVVIDSVKLDEQGTFAFSEKAGDAPEFYRLRIAGQLINLSVDSTETITVKASYPTMSSQYEVKGSDNCSKIKELALLQMNLQAQINDRVNDPNTGVDSVEAEVARLLETYKNQVKTQYIYKEPMKTYAYFALFQTYVLGNSQYLIFNPRNNSEDVKVFAAVATSWDTFHPKSLRGENLHNIALEGIKDARIIRSNANKVIPADKVSVTGIIDIALKDNKGVIRHLTDLKGKVVLLDFHVFATKESVARIMSFRELYNKYHDRGLEIYQVSLDPNEHFWKTQTSELPWISVRDEDGQYSRLYNIQAVPTYFIIDRSNSIYKRDDQVKDLEKEIQSQL